MIADALLTITVTPDGEVSAIPGEALAEDDLLFMTEAVAAISALVVAHLKGRIRRSTPE